MFDVLNNKISDKGGTLKDIQNEMIQSSFNTSFFNDAFQKISEIAERNIDNPQQMEMESSAYIDGATSELDEKSRKTVEKTLKDVQYGYVERAFERFNQNQIDEANQKAAENVLNANEMAINGSKLNLPDRVQSALISNAQANIVDSVKNKRITQQQGIQLTERLARGLILNHLGDIVRSNQYTVEQKMDAIYDFIDGKTGVEPIDKTDPEVRMQAVQQALSMQTQIDAYNKHLDKKNETDRDTEWETRQVALQNLVRNGGDLQTAQDMAAYQRLTARTPEQFNRVDRDLETAGEIKTLPQVKSYLDYVFNDGSKSKEEKIQELNKYDSISAIAPEDFRRYMDSLDSPLAANQKKQSVIIADELARARYGYAEMAPNNAYRYFKAKLDEGLSTATTDSEISKAIKEAQEQTDALYSDRTSAGRVMQIEEFVKEYKVKPEEIDIRLRAEMSRLDKKAARSAAVREKVLPTAYANVMKQIQQEKGLTDDQANVMMNKAQRINMEQ